MAVAAWLAGFGRYRKSTALRDSNDQICGSLH
jgi:hypothetical protein